MGNDVYPWVAENRLATMFFFHVAGDHQGSAAGPA